MQKNTKFPARLVVPMTKELMERLKVVSEREAISMNQIARFGIENIIKKYEKNS